VKLRGYFELAKEEIDKAVRAEEWGLPDDAAAHYRNALRVMLEAKAARVPDAVSSSERGQVRVYQEKIAKWQTQVEERLRVLGQRSGESIHFFPPINLPPSYSSREQLPPSS
jgi:spastin